jgi:CubicO group peptidase (beta-lactamase class C family)
VNESDRALEQYLNGLAADGVVPGGTAAVVGPDGPLLRVAFGALALEPEREPARLDAFYDLASLTKPLVTASLWLLLRERGEADFEAPVTDWLPEFGEGPPRPPTIAELLLHCAGLPSWAPLYALAPGGKSERTAWLGSHREEPGTRAEYGCPAYQLLGFALERASGRPLGELARAELWPGRDDLHLPLPEGLAGLAAPTERGNAFERELAGESASDYRGFRTELIRGQVHDGNAWSLGGAAGNAGLFGTIDGVSALAARFLRPGLFGGETLAELSRNLVPQSARGPGSERRTWGFQLARSENSCAGEALSDRAFGHAGFPGTSVFIDPDREAAYLLLTNRVHPEHRARAFHADRRRFHAAAAAVADRG